MPLLKHKMMYGSIRRMGSIVVQNALFVRSRKTGNLTIPWCTYTDPEVAHVGLYGGDDQRDHLGHEIKNGLDRSGLHDSFLPHPGGEHQQGRLSLPEDQAHPGRTEADAQLVVLETLSKRYRKFLKICRAQRTCGLQVWVLGRDLRIHKSCQQDKTKRKQNRFCS